MMIMGKDDNDRTTTITAAEAKAAATVIAAVISGGAYFLLCIFEFVHKSGVQIRIVYASLYIKVVYKFTYYM